MATRNNSNYPNPLGNNQRKKQAALAHNNLIKKRKDQGKILRLMKTVKENIALPEHKRLSILKKAKGSTWYDGWKPYCLQCSTMNRMAQQEYGFKCKSCGNMIGWDLTRLRESPLNKDLDCE